MCAVCLLCCVVFVVITATLFFFLCFVFVFLFLLVVRCGCIARCVVLVPVPQLVVDINRRNVEFLNSSSLPSSFIQSMSWLPWSSSSSSSSSSARDNTAPSLAQLETISDVVARFARDDGSGGIDARRHLLQQMRDVCSDHKHHERLGDAIEALGRVLSADSFSRDITAQRCAIEILSNICQAPAASEDKTHRRNIELLASDKIGCVKALVGFLHDQDRLLRSHSIRLLTLLCASEKHRVVEQAILANPVSVQRLACLTQSEQTYAHIFFVPNH